MVSARRPIDSLAFLQGLYSSTACPDSALTWRTIADANFGTANLSPSETKKVINRILSRGRSDGSKGNATLRPGMRILIPKQRVPTIPAHELAQTTWWAEVLKQQTWLVLPGRDSPQGKTGPLDPYTTSLISPDQAAIRIGEANQRLRRLERAYQ